MGIDVKPVMMVLKIKMKLEWTAEEFVNHAHFMGKGFVQIREYVKMEQHAVGEKVVPKDIIVKMFQEIKVVVILEKLKNIVLNQVEHGHCQDQEIQDVLNI